MGWIGTAAKIVGEAALTVGPTIIEAGAQIMQGQAQAGAARYQAQMARYEGEYAKKAAAFEEQQHRRDVARFIGEQRVHGARAGSVGAGSDITPFLETEKAGAIDAALIRYGGSVESWRARSQEKLLRSQGAGFETAGYIGAGTTILNTVGRWDWKKSFGQQKDTSLTKLTSGKYRWAPRTASGL